MGRNFGARAQKDVPPPPGSPTAWSLGCVCPQQRNLDFERDACNRRRRLRVVASQCPLHGWEEGPAPTPLTRADVLDVLGGALPDLRRDFKVAELWVFGSVARDKADYDSDVDVLVAFDGSIDLIAFTGLQQRLEDLLETPVDLGTVKSLRSHFKAQVLAERLRVE